MTTRLMDALAEGDVEAACLRKKLAPERRAWVLADYRRGGRPMLAAAVIDLAVYAAAGGHRDDRAPVELGADRYVEARLADPDRARTVADPEGDFAAAIGRGCDWQKLGADDRAYAVAVAADAGWPVIAPLLAILGAERPADLPDGSLVKVACRRYALALLWLRDHRPESLPLSIYAAA